VVHVTFGRQRGRRKQPRADFELDLAFARRAALQSLHGRAIAADDLGTAKLCQVALRATDPWRPRAERGRALSPVELHAIRSCEPLLRRHCANCGKPGTWLCSGCEPLFESAVGGGR
jgi:hypothetical protein